MIQGSPNFIKIMSFLRLLKWKLSSSIFSVIVSIEKFAYLPGECLVISHRKSKLSSFIDIVQKNHNWYISNQQMKAKLLAFHLYRERNNNAKRQIVNSVTLLLFQTTIYWCPPMSLGLGASFSLYHLFLRSPIIDSEERNTADLHQFWTYLQSLQSSLPYKQHGLSSTILSLSWWQW